MIKTVLSSSTGSNIIVSAKKKLTISNIIRQQTGNVPFTAVVTYSNRYTGDYIMNMTIEGIWEGVATTEVVMDMK